MNLDQTLLLLYGFALLCLIFASAAFFFSGQNTPTGQQQNTSSTSLTTASTSSAINVNDQLLPLEVSNSLVGYEKILTDLYIVSYRYQITNPSEEPVTLTSSVSYFLQQQQFADVRGVSSFKSSHKGFKKSATFNARSDNQISKSDFVLGAKQSLTLDLSVQLFMVGTTPPTRNVIEIAGKGKTSTKNYTGTGVAIFYPGIEL
jgi:hypothetical protein